MRSRDRCDDAVRQLELIVLIFVVEYPAPLATCAEYLWVCLVLVLSILSYYPVMILSILKMHKLIEQNERLKQEQHWNHIAYSDVLIGQFNRMSYMEYMNKSDSLRTQEGVETIGVVVLNIDGFQTINDNMGHHIGDAA